MKHTTVEKLLRKHGISYTTHLDGRLHVAVAGNARMEWKHDSWSGHIRRVRVWHHSLRVWLFRNSRTLGGLAHCPANYVKTFILKASRREAKKDGFSLLSFLGDDMKSRCLILVTPTHTFTADNHMALTMANQVFEGEMPIEAFTDWAQDNYPTDFHERKDMTP